MHDPQFTISKSGDVKIGATRISHLDLDPDQRSIWVAVNKLQWDFLSIPIWVVGETIHVWFQQQTLHFHWSDDDAIRAILHEHREPEDFVDFPPDG